MSVGSELRRAREAAGLTLADVARETKIRASLLEHLENDDFDAAGGAVYARGHVRSVAQVIGIDSAPLIADFDAHHESVPKPVLAEALPMGGGRRTAIRERSRPNWLAYGVGATAVITALLAFTLVSEGGGNSNNGSLQGGAKTGGPTSSPTPSTAATQAATPATSPSPKSTDIVAQLTPVAITMKISKASWVEEIQDGSQAFAGTLTAGTTKQFGAQKSIKLIIGNAGGVDLTVNGKHLGSPGADGQVITSTFTPTSTTGQG